MAVVKRRIKVGHLNPHILRAKIWLAAAFAVGALAAAGFVLLAYPVQLLVERGVSAGTVELAWRAAARLALEPDLLVRTLREWIHAEVARSGRPPILPLAMPVAGLLVGAGTVWRLSGPHSFRETHMGGAEWADDDFLEENDFFAECGFILGRHGDYRNGRLIRYPETLSAMIIAPPGTGKTVTLISNIVGDHPDKRVPVPAPSMIINDPKGEIYSKTAGWRSTLGPVFHIRWTDLEGACFNPLSILNIPGGERIVPLLTELRGRLAGIYEEPKRAVAGLLIAARDFGDEWRRRCRREPDLGFAVRDAMPGVTKLDLRVDPAAAGRAFDDELFRLVVELNAVYTSLDSYVDRLVAIAVPESNGGVDSHWIVNGRAALSGFMLYQVMRSIDETIDRGEAREATFGGLLSWLASADVDPDDKAPHDLSKPPPDEEQNQVGGDEDDDQDDVGRLLLSAIAEARARGYPARVGEELGALRSKPPRERGSVISNAIGKLNIFKSAAIRARTSRSDFTFADMRGIDGRPVTVYFDVPLQDAEAVGVPTGFFIEGVAAFLISQSEEEAQTRPVVFQLDEFWTLPKLEVIQQIPALGRGQWVQLCLIGQSRQQAALKLGEKALDVLVDAIPIKLYFAIASHKQAKEVSESIGNQTVETENISANTGLSLQDMVKGQTSKSFQSLPLIRPEELMSLEKLNPRRRKWGELVIQMSGAASTPILCRPALWFKDRRMRRRVKYRAPGFVKGPRGVRVKPWPNARTGVDSADTLEEAPARPRGGSLGAYMAGLPGPTDESNKQDGDPP